MIPSRPLSFSPWRLCALLAAAVLAGCASEPTPPTPTVEEAAAIAKQPKAMQPRKPADMKSRIVRFLPRQVQDKPGWANDVVTAAGG